MKITKVEERRRWNSLSGVRAAIKGWAFVADDQLESYLLAGRSEVLELSEDMREHGYILLQPIADAIVRRNKES